MTALAGLTVSASGDPAAVWLLTGLGAAPVPRRADLDPRVVDDLGDLDVDGGLPPGTLAWANSVAAAVAALGGFVSSQPVAASATGVACAVWLPSVMAASYQSPVTMAPGPPRAFSGGYLHADVSSPGDAALFESCLASLPAGASAEAAASEAQAWRLAVCDYRSRVTAEVEHPVAVRSGGPAEDRGFSVVDLTTMWAGPLAVWLLSRFGGSVTRVEPAFRPDGFRALDGGGIHPSGVQCDPGRDSGLFNALHTVDAAPMDLDLRTTDGRSRFEDLAGAADLVVDSFSARVMENLGYGTLPGATRASVTAFGPGPRSGWVAYGTGVHAALGLGDLGDGRYTPGAVSYPDPIGGLVLAMGALAAMAGRRLGAGVSHVSTSLAGSVQPILARPAGAWSPAVAIGPALLERATGLGLFETRPVCGQQLAHPSTIFLSNQNVF